MQIALFRCFSAKPCAGKHAFPIFTNRRLRPHSSTTSIDVVLRTSSWCPATIPFFVGVLIGVAPIVATSAECHVNRHGTTIIAAMSWESYSPRLGIALPRAVALFPMQSVWLRHAVDNANGRPRSLQGTAVRLKGRGQAWAGLRNGSSVRQRLCQVPTVWRPFRRGRNTSHSSCAVRRAVFRRSAASLRL